MQISVDMQRCRYMLALQTTGDGHMYLCKRDLNKRDAEGNPAFVAIIGHVVKFQDGYRFLPAVSGHRGSRKAWPSVTACIPKWTEKYGYLELNETRDLPFLPR